MANIVTLRNRMEEEYCKIAMMSNIQYLLKESIKIVWLNILKKVNIYSERIIRDGENFKNEFKFTVTGLCLSKDTKNFIREDLQSFSRELTWHEGLIANVIKYYEMIDSEAVLLQLTVELNEFDPAIKNSINKIKIIMNKLMPAFIYEGGPQFMNNVKLIDYLSNSWDLGKWNLSASAISQFMNPPDSGNVGEEMPNELQSLTARLQLLLSGSSSSTSSQEIVQKTEASSSNISPMDSESSSTSSSSLPSLVIQNTSSQVPLPTTLHILPSATKLQTPMTLQSKSQPISQSSSLVKISPETKKAKKIEDPIDPPTSGTKKVEIIRKMKRLDWNFMEPSGGSHFHFEKEGRKILFPNPGKEFGDGTAKLFIENAKNAGVVFAK